MKLLTAFVVVCVTVLATILLLSSSGSSSTKPLDLVGEHAATRAPSGSAATEEVLDPFALAKNPYIPEERRLLLKTSGMPMLDPLGNRRGEAPYPGLRFSKMLDRETALYEVLVARYTIGEAEGNLAVVIVPGSRPEIGQPWKVAVHAPLTVVNGFGAQQEIATVTFLGYGELPTPRVVPPTPMQEPQPEPTPKQNDDEQRKSSTDDVSPNASSTASQRE